MPEESFRHHLDEFLTAFRVFMALHQTENNAGEFVCFHEWKPFDVESASCHTPNTLIYSSLTQFEVKCSFNTIA